MRNLLKFAICASSPLWLASIALGQDYIGRYDIYTGYMYLSSPLLNLGESGFNTQIGMQPAKWYSLGFDFSAGTGDTALIPSMLKSSLRQQIAAQLSLSQKAGADVAGGHALRHLRAYHLERRRRQRRMQLVVGEELQRPLEVLGQ